MLHLVVWQFWGRAAEAPWAVRLRAFVFFARHIENPCGPVYFEHAGQYPPISSRDTTI
jgi:hypothetical protein